MGINASYRPGISFAKAGVMLVDLKSEGLVQHELDLEPEPAARGHLMTALDELNERYGPGHRSVGQRWGQGATQRLGDEAKLADTAVHHPLGEYACGAGMKWHLTLGV